MIIVIALGLGACKSKDNSLNGNLLRSYPHHAETAINPPPKNGAGSGGGAIVPPSKNGAKKTNGATNGVNNGEMASDKTPIERTPKKEAPPGPPPPEFLPPPVPPLPPKPEGFVEYDGPVLNLCGNGVLDKIFSYTTCNPVLSIVLSAVCVPMLYIEQCDDHNTLSNDGCSNACMKECCGNGIVEFGETCDAGQRTGALPPNFSPPAGFPPTTIAPPPIGPGGTFPTPVPQSACSSTIPTTDVGNCSRHCQLIICGDGIVNGNEECDDGNDQCCDGCFQCRLELPNTCPCNCVPPNVRCPDPSKPCPEI